MDSWHAHVARIGPQKLPPSFVEIGPQIYNIWVVKYAISDKTLRPEAAGPAILLFYRFAPTSVLCGRIGRNLRIESGGVDFSWFLLRTYIICSAKTACLDGAVAQNIC